MKAVILAGGFGTRLSENTHLMPKPMVEIGGMPILWHIMKIYSAHGINDFVVCLGYKGYFIKEWFANYFLHTSDVCIDLSQNSVEILNSKTESWKVTLIDTGLHTMTGSRIKQVQKYVGDSTFLLTYGDGVGDINITESIHQHKLSKKHITVTAYKPKGKFGSLNLEDDGSVSSFTEKPAGDGVWVNAGYFVCEPEVFQYIGEGRQVIFEREPLETLAQNGNMNAFVHQGFWKPMDILKDNKELNEMWDEDCAPWKIW